MTTSKNFSSVAAILSNLIVGFGEDTVKEVCEKYLAGEIKPAKPTRRKTGPRGKSSWNIYVEEVLEEMRGTDSEVTHKMAMSEASRRRRENDPTAEQKYHENKAKREAKKAAKTAAKDARQAQVFKQEVLEGSVEKGVEVVPVAQAVVVAAAEKISEVKSKKSSATEAAKTLLPKSLPASVAPSAAPSAAPSDNEATSKARVRGRPTKK
jgi:hypothetical protein